MTNFEIITDSGKATSELLFSNEDAIEVTISDRYSNTIMTKVLADVYKSVVQSPNQSLEGVWWMMDRLFYYSPLILLLLTFYVVVTNGLKLICKKPTQRKVSKAKTP